MKLSISNIAWPEQQNEDVYGLMKKYGYQGLEIAPGKIIKENPYDFQDEAAAWADKLRQKHGFVVSSMQSVWYGRKEQLFGTEAERAFLLAYTKKAVTFACKAGCKNLVFGCPANRSVPKDKNAEDAVPFFREAGGYAASKNAALAMEANPPIYHTNYINDTPSAIRLVEKTASPGFLLNLDVGTMIQNRESPDILFGKGTLISHVHISEPFLAPVKARTIHRELADCLREERYQGFVSIEMKEQQDLMLIEEALHYVKEVFGGHDEGAGQSGL